MTLQQVLLAAAAVSALIGAILALRRNATGGVRTEGAADIWADDRDEDPVASLVTGQAGDQFLLAGITDPKTRMWFGIVRIATTLAGAVAGMMFGGGPGVSIVASGAVAMSGAVLGWWIPGTWLRWKQSKRRAALSADFPLMLDLLQISIQGGMSLISAWRTVTMSLQGVENPLAEEMRRIDLEVNLQSDWGPALDAATARTGLPQFRSLGLLLAQTQRFGTEVSAMVQVLADSIRHEELQNLEEQAHEASVKTLFPLAVFLLPSTLILIVFPLISMLFDALAKATPN